VEEDLSSYHIGFLDCIQEKRIGREAGEQAEPGTSTRWQMSGIRSPNYDSQDPVELDPCMQANLVHCRVPFWPDGLPPHTPSGSALVRRVS
jgi:hypothetical protein